MQCLICLDPIGRGTCYSAHTITQHEFHFQCIMDRFLNSDNPEFNCPHCGNPLEDLDPILADDIYGFKRISTLWISNSPKLIRYALENSYTPVHYKIYRLQNLAKAGIQEGFQLIWSTLAYDAISAEDLHSIECSSVISPDIGFLKFAVEKGYFQIQSLYRALPKATANGNIEAVKYLLDIGANHVAGPLTADNLEKQVKCRDSMAFFAAQSNEHEILQLLLENGYTISEHQVLEALQMLSTNFQVRSILLSLISGGLGIPHIDNEKIDCEENSANSEEYSDYCEGHIQDDNHVEPLEHKLTVALSDSRDLDHLKELARNDFDNLSQCFPEFSDKVLQMEKYDFLLSLGCDVRPSGGLFAKIIQEHQLEAIPKLIDAGIVLTDKLFKQVIPHLLNLPSGLLDILQIFEDHGVDINDEGFWIKFADAGDVESALYLVETIGLEHVFEDEWRLQFLSENFRMSPVIRYLVENGLGHDAIDRIVIPSVIVADNLELFLFLLERDPTLDIYNYVDHIIQDFETEEIRSHVFKSLIDINRLTDDQVYGISGECDLSFTLDIMTRLRDQGRILQYNRIAIGSLCFNSLGLLKDLFVTFPDEYRDKQTIFERSVSLAQPRAIKHIMLNYPDDIEINSTVLEYARGCRDESCAFLAVKAHSEECLDCVGIHKNVMHQLPSDILKDILIKHRIDQVV